MGSERQLRPVAIYFTGLMALFATLPPTVVSAGSAGSSQSSSSSSQSDADLAQQLTNPVANMIQIPFQNNFDLGGGRNNDASRYTLNVQPIIPFTLDKDWNLITRTIIPYANWQGVFPETQTGLGDIVQSFFISPSATPSGIVWGAGPVFLYPTATNSVFGGRQWGAGPTFVGLQMNGAWTYGALINHIWSLSKVPGPPAFAEIGDNNFAIERQPINATFLQPFVSYTLPTQTTLSLTSESLYDWSAQRWTVPINVGINQLISVYGQKMQLGGQIRCYVETPTGGPTWGFQLRWTLVFPVSGLSAMENMRSALVTK